MEVGYYPEIILAGRKLNDSMGKYVANEIINLMTKKRIQVVDSNILVMGLTFKENCPDTRNSKVVDMANMLASFHTSIDVYDPYVDEMDVPGGMKANFIKNPEKGAYDCIILAVKHSLFIEMGSEKIRNFGKEKHVLFDLKYAFDASEADGRL